MAYTYIFILNIGNSEPLKHHVSSHVKKLLSVDEIWLNPGLESINL